MNSSFTKYPIPSVSCLTGKNTNCDSVNFDSWRDGQTKRLAVDSYGFEAWRKNQNDASASRPGTSASRPGTSASRPGTSASRPSTSGGTLESAPLQRPGTSYSMSSADLAALQQPQRPGSKAGSSRGGTRMAASWSGPLTGLIEAHAQQQMMSSLSQPNTPRCLSRMSQRSALRPHTSASAASCPNLTSTGPLACNTLSHPGGSHLMLQQQMQGPPDSWTMNNIAALTGDPNALARAQFSTPTQRKGRFEPKALALPPAGTLIALNQPNQHSPSKFTPFGSGPIGSDFNSTSSQRLRWPPLGSCAPSSLTQVPTRGMVYSVFSELDRFGCGKLTYTVLEDAGVRIGLKQEAVKCFYDLLDPHQRGYVTINDWGKAEVQTPASNFSRLFLQTRRVPDEATLAPVICEANSLNAAMNLMVLKLKLKNHGMHVPHAMLLSPFKFVDSENAGVLSSDGLFDMFVGMGITVSPEVVEEAVQYFGPNAEGTVPYQKFVDAVYPKLVPDLLKEYRSRVTGVVDNPSCIKTGY